MAKTKKKPTTEEKSPVVEDKVKEPIIEETPEKEVPVVEEKVEEVVVKPKEVKAKPVVEEVVVEKTVCEKCSIVFDTAPCKSCVVYKRLKK